MPKTLLRGRVLTFVGAPLADDDASAYRYFDDGGVLVENGLILACGDYAEIEAEGAEVIDHRPHLILPGFIDTHNHFPQVQVIASYGAQLLDWLNTYTFPEEMKFSDQTHADRMAVRYFDEMLRNGTTTPVAYCSVHPESTDAYFAEAERRNMRVIGGKVMMDRNAPDGLLDTAQTS
ncbi:MAG TPA: amidohydrolase family protein, partial [Paracoccaceae bacterium]|nr:amidohydrolase family protein [Paracoccaceae bacterium]